MSAGGKKKTACVTGGNGYIASALVKMLLEKGYAVKTTVRNPVFSLTVMDPSKRNLLSAYLDSEKFS
ncbi:hypothetical protein EJB05_47539, partial [Eragrostis curvula]